MRTTHGLRCYLSRLQKRQLALAALALSLLPGHAFAAGAIPNFRLWDTAVEHESLVNTGDSVKKTAETGGKSSMANNPALGGSAWAHQADFFSVQVTNGSKLNVRVNATNPASFAPGVSVWAIGNAFFDGGTTNFGGEMSGAGFGTPHSFNAYGALGDTGTLWMQDGQGGNAKELLANAISGPSYTDPTGWGETIQNGAFDKSVSNTYTSGVTGSVGSGFVELMLEDIADGWYLIYVGGTDHSTIGGTFDLTVTTVPEPGSGLLLAGGLAFLAHARSRRR